MNAALSPVMMPSTVQEKTSRESSIVKPGDLTKAVFGLRLFRRTHRHVLRYLLDSIRCRENKTLFFVNAHTVNTMYEKSGYRQLLNEADLLLPDGIGIELAIRRQGDSLEENLCGTDFIEPLCRSGLRLFLLGGKDNTAERAAQTFRERWGATVVGTHHGYIKNYTKAEKEELFATIHRARADVILVGMGQPMQEEWILEHREQLAAPITMGVGGLFDYFSGNVKRAPLFWRKARMEWVYRMIQEPERLWKRYILGNPLFLWRMFQS